VPANGGFAQAVESDLPHLPSYLHFPAEDPVTIANGLKVFFHDPLARLLWVATARPPPQRSEDHTIHSIEGLFAGHVLMVVGPPSEDWVE